MIVSSRKPDKSASRSWEIASSGNLAVSLPRNDWVLGYNKGSVRVGLKPDPYAPLYPRVNPSLRESSNEYWNDRGNLTKLI
jgi:hypothetical protein